MTGVTSGFYQVPRKYLSPLRVRPKAKPPQIILDEVHGLVPGMKLAEENIFNSSNSKQQEPLLARPEPPTIRSLSSWTATTRRD